MGDLRLKWTVILVLSSIFLKLFSLLLNVRTELTIVGLIDNSFLRPEWEPLLLPPRTFQIWWIKSGHRAKQCVCEVLRMGVVVVFFVSGSVSSSLKVRWTVRRCIRVSIEIDVMCPWQWRLVSVHSTEFSHPHPPLIKEATLGFRYELAESGKLRPANVERLENQQSTVINTGLYH
jgi:hypothetical protein